MTVYFISGLGADKRAFTRIRLPESIHVKHMQWDQPQQGISLSEYAKLFSRQIDTAEPFIIVGLSFGGIMAIELMHHVKPLLTILISSMSCRKEIPAIFRIAGSLHINRILPYRLLNRPNAFGNWLFGVRTPHERELFKQIIVNTSPLFLSWAIDRILHWDRIAKPTSVYHVHGSKDNLLPVRNTCADLVIEGGGHLMVYTHAEVISKVIADKISEVYPDINTSV